MSCSFVQHGDGFRCELCGRIYPKRIIVNCPKQAPAKVPPREPSKARQVYTYSMAVAKWVAAGKPQRTQEEIDATLAICAGCEMFIDDGRPRCRLCGCSVNSQPNGLINKIAMATESCPATPPRWTATAPPAPTAPPE